MSFLNNLSHLLSFGKKEERKEYFFALNIGVEELTAALWVIEGNELKILEIASDLYSSDEEIAAVTDRLLDRVLGLREIEPQKILFGVPNSWLSDDNLKEEYLKLLRNLVKELELIPMAYVAISHAMVHFLEKQENVPTTAILIGFEKLHLTVTVVRAGKLDGVKFITRGENSGSDIEKALLTFTDVETLPSKILIYGEGVQELKSQLLSFSWMSKLSFLHFPKIDVLSQDLEIKSVCLAGGSEINNNIKFTERSIQQTPVRSAIISESEGVTREAKEESRMTGRSQEEGFRKGDNLGFVVGDVSNQIRSEDLPDRQAGQQVSESHPEAGRPLAEEESEEPEETKEQELTVSQEPPIEIGDFEQEFAPKASPAISPRIENKRKFNFKRLTPSFTSILVLIGVIGAVVLLIGAYLTLLKADVKIFVEPKILEKDTQVVADPNQKTVNEDGKIIPGQIVDVEVSGQAKDAATGKRQIGDSAKGTVTIRNKTDSEIVLSKGTVFSSSGGLKFNLDLSVTVASRSADDGTWGKATGTVTASSIGADGNLPSGSDFVIAGYSAEKSVAKSEGNFSGGTSKDVTVVSSEDQQKLLAKLSSDLRQQAQQKLQDKFPDKKVLQEALSEQITRKSYNKNINDQASEFSLNMTIRYKGTAFEDKDLKLIVSKLVTTQVPDGFELDLSETETQADVSKLEKDGKLVFLARFKAKLMPKIDVDKIRDQIKFKTPSEVADMLKGMDNVLGSEIKMSLDLPTILQRLPILSKNIKIEVGLK